MPIKPPSKMANYQKGIIAQRATLLDFDIKDQNPKSIYRQMLFDLTGETTTRDMNNHQRADVIKHLDAGSKSLPGGHGNNTRYKKRTSRKLVMQWADIREQGKLRSEEARLEDWLNNQYDKPNPDWLSPEQSEKAIEQLKTWQKRKV